MISSLPYSVDFKIPAVKIQCGDQFSMLLTSEGQVYSWGLNVYGQLGLSDTTAAAVLYPQLVKFTQPKDKIIDISAGYNHCLALNDSY